MNTKEQGAIGVGHAIAHYSAKGYAVFVPIADIKRYDLIVDTGTELLRVEVKTTTNDRGQVKLLTCGGNQSWNGVSKKLSSDDCDLVFAINLNTGAIREFPSSELHGRSSVKVA